MTLMCALKRAMGRGKRGSRVSFYLVSGFAHKQRADFVADALVAAGMRQTFRWTDWSESAAHPGFAVGPGYVRCPLWEIACREIEAIRQAQVVIALEPLGYGSHVEIGAALSAFKPVVLVGENWNPGNPFYQHPLVYRLPIDVDSLEAPGALDRLQELLAGIALARAEGGSP